MLFLRRIRDVIKRRGRERHSEDGPAVAALLECERAFMRPWRMTSESSGAVHLEFKPFYERAGDTNLLVIRSTVHQVFGRYYGTLHADGRTIPVDGVVGWAEEHRARW
ncbi:MAG TPA: DUF2804 family protein [Candidatus Hydrogenedentes bacterium]|nr:DUF2804 family protein [Candidatus Hydrogenedentota bacterium]HQH52223.1 DUF2804 family protein [Candidatus Hydrogenedentota bacterium]